jgi:hypothetical protein
MAAVAAIALTCAIFVASASASALGPQEFAVYGTSGSQTGVWTADPGGGSIHYLGVGTHPSLSSDGLEVAYSREKCLALAAVSGGTPLEMICDYTLPPRDVEWNSYGDSIAFAGDLNHKGFGIFSRMRDLSGVTVHLVDWPSDQISPTWAPSGKLAFISAVNAAGASVGGNQLWIKQGSGFNENIYQLTGVGGAFAGPVQNAAWSPDGKLIAVNAYHKTQGGKDPEAIALINASNGIVEQWLLDKDGEYNTNPQWTPDGKNIAFTAESSSHTNRRIEMVTIAGTNRHQVVSSLSPSEWVSFQRARSGEPLDYNTLLYRYAPQLRYDIQEQYFADSAAEATDNPSNRIMALDRETVLAAHAEGFTTPSLKLLEEPAYQSSYIDEGPEYAEDAALLHAKEAYGNRIYGRVHQEAESGWTWLQYFFYYYYDSQDAVGIGVHEGDWETVAFRLDQNGVPDLAIYSRHGSESAACPATDVEWAPGWSGAAPIVYVANASHANYFEAGQKDRTFPLPNDEAHGDGAIIRPSLEQVTDGVAEGGPLPVPAWFAWPGRWGSSWDSGGIDQESPQSPAIQKKRWEELPQFMAESVFNCDNGETGGAQPLSVTQTQLAAPEVSAKRQGDSILVHYRVPPPEKHRKLLYLTVTSAKEKDATRSKTLPLKRDTGTVRLPVPLASGPYIATASTLDENSERSDVDTAPVQP